MSDNHLENFADIPGNHFSWKHIKDLNIIMNGSATKLPFLTAMWNSIRNLFLTSLSTTQASSAQKECSNVLDMVPPISTDFSCDILSIQSRIFHGKGFPYLYFNDNITSLSTAVFISQNDSCITLDVISPLKKQITISRKCHSGRQAGINLVDLDAVFSSVP